MATFEEENAARQRLTQLLTELAGINPQELIREDVLGRDLSFASGVPYFQRMLKLFKDLSDSSLESVPFPVLQQLASLADQARQRFKRIREFSIQTNPSNPTAARDNLINEVRNSYDEAFQSVSPVIAYSVRKGTDFEKLELDARQSVDEIKKILADERTAQAGAVAEITSTLEKVRRAAQEVGVAQHAIHFRDEAKASADSASTWLVITAILAGLTLLFGLGSLAFIIIKTPDYTPSQSVQLAIAKLIIFSVLLSATVWSGRTYRATRHNYVVNKHRQNALSTFETFAKAAVDEATKSAVLVQATTCIFSAQQTGYIAQEEPEGGFPHILEIVRKAAEGK